MEINISGRTLDEAVENACKELGKEKGEFSYEIVEYPKAGFLGFGGKPAIIRINQADEASAKAADFLKGIFSLSGVSEDEYTLDLDESTEGKLNVTLTGEALDLFTKRQGEAVEALQLMLSLAINKRGEDYTKVLLDINNNKEVVAKKLEALAVKTSRQVLKTKRKVTLNSMSAYQRRIIHSKLQGVESITTFSVGEEPNRKVVIAYQWKEGERRPRPYNKPSTKENSDN